jgi:hypothetical protein
MLRFQIVLHYLPLKRILQRKQRGEKKNIKTNLHFLKVAMEMPKVSLKMRKPTKRQQSPIV